MLGFRGIVEIRLHQVATVGIDIDKRRFGSCPVGRVVGDDAGSCAAERSSDLGSDALRGARYQNGLIGQVLHTR